MSTRLDKHDKVALAASGGKDSTACVWLLKDYLDRITIYHVDTGDELPEVRDAVAAIEAMAPHFVRVTTDVIGWIAAHGLPSDLVPHSAHQFGQVMGEGQVRLAARYDCCHANRAGALFARIKADGNTMMISGIRRDDMRVMSSHDGDVLDGIEVFYPVETWSTADVLAYLANVGAPLPPFYPELAHGVDCAGCSAWWSEERGAYLRRVHPELYRQYQARLQLIVGEITRPLQQLARELERHE
jgi:phosphoadenosine phosphosulfate reductase